MDQFLNSAQRDRSFNLEHFRIRLTARLGIILACIVLYIPRLYRIIGNGNLNNISGLLTIIALPFQSLMAIVIVLEYFLFKKLGPGIVKYSTLVDLMLLLFFTADWVLVTIATLYNTQQSSPPCLKMTSVLNFTAFSWRTLMVTLIVQNWQLKIIAPVLALSITTGFAIHYSPENKTNLLFGSLSQLVDIILILYCEDRVKWKMVWANIQKEKWMQMNNFILNSLPENIMILDLKGETKFISEYFKSFIQKCHLPLDTKELFRKVQDLKQQKFEPDENKSPPTSMVQIERLATENKLLTDDEKDKDSPRNQVLEDLIISFQKMITNEEIQERQFLIYNGKLKIDESHHDKSLEVKISFLQHFEVYYIILIIRDTTQRDLLMTLEEANRYKDQLLASVSHELRAPLNGNINLVESAVNSSKIPESIKESLLIPALRSSKFLLHIINDILDMSQIKEKKLRLVFQSENLKETLKSTAQLVELQAKKKGIQLLLEIDPTLPRIFSTDHIRLSQIVLNLLNNAIKFTKEGVVKLTAKRIIDSSSVQITVEDSGIGMNQENLKKLFLTYTHVEFEERKQMNPTGVGLGLNIAYSLVLLLSPKDKQGISVKSVPGQGSVFTFIIENKENIQIELEEDSQEAADELSVPIESALFPKLQRLTSGGSSSSIVPIIEKKSCSCPQILIVDDNAFNTMAFETILSSLEIKCDSVYSGSACIKSLLNRHNRPCGENCKPYSVVFMDQEMPEMTGIETVYEIKRLQEENLLRQNIKVIGCTAHKSKEEVEKFMEAGIDQCIHKPISVSMIKDILKGT